MANAFVTTVCPVLGNILGVIMLLSPIPAVLEVRKSQRLGALNALPYPLTVLNCFGWVAYGIVLQNMFIIPANIVGMCAGMYFFLQCYPFMERKVQDQMLGLFVGGFAYFSLLGLFGVFGLGDDRQIQMWGIQCVVVLLMYYAVPLSTMWEVIKSRNAASIYMPLAIACVCNGTLWTLYGLFATHDFNVWMPNGIGAILGVVQIILRVMYGAHDHKTPEVAGRDVHVHVEHSLGSETGSANGWRSGSDIYAKRALLSAHWKSFVSHSDESSHELNGHLPSRPGANGSEAPSLPQPPMPILNAEGLVGIGVGQGKPTAPIDV